MTVPGTLHSTLVRTKRGDPLYSKVMMLLNFEGGVVDATGKNSVTSYGNATVVAGTSKFGTRSLYLDGNLDYLQVPDSANFAFDTGDFCIECWAMPTAFNAYSRLFCKGILNTATSLDMEFGSSDVARPRMPSASFPTVTGCGFTTNTWHHVAMTRSAGTSYFFIDGVLKYSVASGGSATNATPWYIGIHPASLTASTSFAGYIDEFRVTKGAARYTSNFAVPTQAFLTQ